MNISVEMVTPIPSKTLCKSSVIFSPSPSAKKVCDDLYLEFDLSGKTHIELR